MDYDMNYTRKEVTQRLRGLYLTFICYVNILLYIIILLVLLVFSPLYF